MIFLNYPPPFCMLNQTNLNYKQHKIWSIAVAATGLLLIITSFLLGKTQFFLLMNGDIGYTADMLFKYITHLGDGAFWVLWVPALIIIKGKRFIPFVVSIVAISTFFTQFSKQVIYPYEVRPLLGIANQSLVHYVPGVEIHSINSFPSGHTATAFSFFLIISLLSHKKYIAVTSFMLAVLVGYSRIYLGQHFPLDVGAGMLVAVISTGLALRIQIAFEKKSRKRVTKS